MLRIVVNDQDVDLEGVKFNLQLNSPIPFNPEDGMVEGGFAFGVNFPGTLKNKKIFGYPDRLELYPEGETDFPGLLYFNGRVLFKIIVSLTNAGEYMIRANIKVNLGYYTNQIADKSIRDLAFEGDIALGTTTQEVIDHANSMVALSYPQAKYNFPEIYNPKFYGEENKMNPSYRGFVNFYVHGTGFRPNVVDNDNELHNYYNLCPLPYLFYVLEKCYSEFGYSPVGPVLRDTELASLLIYNNYTLDLQEDRYKSIGELSADQIIPAAETQLNFDLVTTNIDNCYDGVIYKYRITKSGDHRITGTINAQAIDTFGAHHACECNILLYIDDVMVAEIAGDNDTGGPYLWDINLDYTQFVDVADIGKYISLRIKFIMLPGVFGYFAPGTVFADSWWGCQNITWSTLNIYAKSINIQNHVPDVKISAFLITLLKLFGIVHVFKDGASQVELHFLKDILSSAEEENYSGYTAKSSRLSGFRTARSYKLDYAWSSSDEYTKENFRKVDPQKLIGTFDTVAELPATCVEGYVAIIRNINSAYRYEDGSWVWFTDLFYPLEVGDGVTPINFEASPLTMYDNRDNPASTRVCPKINQEGSSYNLGKKDFGFHLVFYRGLVADEQGHTYPFASSTKYGPTGTVIANYDLIIDSDNGIFTVWLEKYYDFVMNRTRPVEYDRLFSSNEIQEMDLLVKKRIFQHLFLLAELNIPINNTSLGIASIKLQKI